MNATARKTAALSYSGRENFIILVVCKMQKTYQRVGSRKLKRVEICSSPPPTAAHYCVTSNVIGKTILEPRRTFHFDNNLLLYHSGGGAAVPLRAHVQTNYERDRPLQLI